MSRTAQCRSIQLLVPWYVTGTLDQDDMNRVAGHLEKCPDCRQAVEAEMQLARHCVANSDRALSEGSAGQDSDREASLNQLLLNTLAEEPKGQQAYRGIHRSRVAIAAVCVGLLVVGYLALPYLPANNTEYRTLTSERQSTAPVMQVMFARGTAEQEINRILTNAGVGIVSGPSPQGVYRVSLPEGAKRESLAILMPGLRAQPAVVLVEEEL